MFVWPFDEKYITLSLCSICILVVTYRECMNDNGMFASIFYLFVFGISRTKHERMQAYVYTHFCNSIWIWFACGIWTHVNVGVLLTFYSSWCTRKRWNGANFGFKTCQAELVLADKCCFSVERHYTFFTMVRTDFLFTKYNTCKNLLLFFNFSFF